MSGEDDGSLLNTGLQVGGSLANAYLAKTSAEDAASELTSGLREGQAASQAAVGTARGDILATAAPGLEDLISGFQGAISVLESPGAAEMKANQLAGVLGPEQQQLMMDEFLQSPGQQYLRDEQEQSLLRNAAAIGGLGGGRVRSALQGQAHGRAATGQQQFLQNLVQMSLPAQTRSANIANILSSGGGQLAGFRSGLGSNLANISMGGAAQQIPLITGTGQAQAAGILGANTAVQSGLGGVAKTLGNL